MTEWRPITGILPPISQDEWNEEFDKYKATPEFKLYVYLQALGIGLNFIILQIKLFHHHR